MKETIDEILSFMKKNLVSIKNENLYLACDGRGCLTKIDGTWELISDDFAKGIIHAQFDFFFNELKEMKEDILEFQKEKHEVKCNMCEWKGTEDDLVLFEDNEEEGKHVLYEPIEHKEGETLYGKGCPNCKVDHYLMDIEIVL